MSFDFKGTGFDFQGTGFGQGPGGFNGDAADPSQDIYRDVEYTGGLEEDCLREFAALDTAYTDRAKAEAARRREATNSFYWTTLVFRDEKSRDKFFRLVTPRNNDILREGGLYADGHQFAKALGIDLDDEKQ